MPTSILQLFCDAVSVNHGGPGALTDPRKRKMAASSNLKAGNRAVASSDFNTAFKLFEYGVSFLSNDHWTVDYDLSVCLFDAAAEAGK